MLRQDSYYKNMRTGLHFLIRALLTIEGSVPTVFYTLPNGMLPPPPGSTELIVLRGCRTHGGGRGFLYVCVCCTFKLRTFTHIFGVSSGNSLQLR